jgi:hypothetical protein
MRFLNAFRLVFPAALMCAACDPPPVIETAQDVAVRGEAAPVELPQAVAATREQLLIMAESGETWQMAQLAAQTPGFVSNTGGMGHREYWYLKYRTGDWPMAQMGRVLAWPHAVEETPSGRVFVWPYMAKLSPGEIGPGAARDINALAGEGAVDAMRAGAPWPGYSLGVREDGVWLFFVSGAG